MIKEKDNIVKLSFIEIIASIKYVLGIYTILIISMATLVATRTTGNWIQIFMIYTIALTLLLYIYWWICINISHLLDTLVNEDINQFAEDLDFVVDSRFKLLGYHLSIHGEFSGYPIQIDLSFIGKTFLNQYQFHISAFVEDLNNTNHKLIESTLKENSISLISNFAHLDKCFLIVKGENIRANLTSGLKDLTSNLAYYKISPLKLTDKK